MSNEIEIYEYILGNGRNPFQRFLKKLDVVSRATIRARINRIRNGNFGDIKTIKNSDGIKEIRIFHGPGYRVYFGIVGKKIILLLAGGNKSSQSEDIEKAKIYWIDYKNKYKEND